MLKKGVHHSLKGEGWKDAIGCYFLLIDYSDGTVVSQAVEKGHPWYLGKGQDGFLALSDMISPELIEDPHQVELELKLNGVTRQNDITGNMHFKIYD